MILADLSTAGHRVITKLLIENGVDLNARDAAGSTALDLAAGNGNASVVCALESAGAKRS